MEKKQLLSIMLAASMTVGIIPAVSGYAAENNTSCEMQMVLTDDGYNVLVDNPGSESSGVLYTAVYNSSGALTELERLPVTLESGSNTFTTSLTQKRNTTVKSFLWNDEQKPLANAEEATDIFDIRQCSVINAEQVYYGVLTLKSDSADNYDFTLNGETIYPTAVNDAKTVVKFEINPNEKAIVCATAKSDEKMQKVSIGSGTSEFTGVIENEAPEKVLTSGPVSYFDYYLSNYDKDGNIRREMTKSTFDTDSEGEEEIDYTLPILSASKTPLGDDIEITFDASTPEAKQWQVNIYEVVKDYGMSASSRMPLAFNVSDGKITISAQSAAILDRNGKHDIIIKSNGYNDARIEIEIVKTAGELYLHGDFNWWANQTLLFVLDDFNYAVTNPIYEVQLDGVTLLGNCEDYHVVSNLVRLENNCLPWLTPGEHTITVKAEGFADYVKTFVLETAPNGEQNPVWGDDAEEAVQSASAEVYDMVSMASVGGSGGSTDSGSIDDELTVRANVIFDFDLIANAKILRALNKATPYAETIINWWDSLTKDGIIKTDGKDMMMTYTYFKNNSLALSSGYMTYKKLYDREVEKEKSTAFTLNRPYMVKNMLEDGLLGLEYIYSEAAGKASPVLTAEGRYVGEDIVISYSDTDDSEEWADSIYSVMSGSFNYLKNYVIDKENRTITIPAENNAILKGANNITVYADSYKSTSVTVNVERKNESDFDISLDSDSNVIVSGMTDDFTAAIREIYLNGSGLFNDSQVGGYGDYEIKSNVLVLRSKLFDENEYSNQKTLRIQADGYSDVILQFTISQLVSNGETVLENVPEYVVLSDKNTLRPGVNVSITVGSILDNKYSDAVTEVTVNGNNAENISTDFRGTEYLISGELFPTVGEYTIVIKADGYKDKEFTVTVDDASVQVPDYVKIYSENIKYGENAKIYIGAWGSTEYYNAFEKAVIDGIEYDKNSLNIGMFTYCFEISDLSVGEHTIVLYADGYENKSFAVTVEKADTPSVVRLIQNGSMTDDTEISLEDNELKIAVGYSLNDVYVNALSAVEVNNREISISDVNIESETVGFGSYAVLTISNDNLNAGENTVTLKADNYKDKTFTVVATEQPESGDADLKPAPEVYGQDKHFFYDYYTVTFTGGYNQAEYIEAIEKITVDGMDYEKVEYMSSYSGIWRANSTDGQIFIGTESLAKGEHEVIIIANSYEDNTFILTVE